jgi:SHS2 domain-containing protein
MERYRVLEHTADTAIEAEAASLSGLVENLAYGMFDLMFDLTQVASRDTARVEVSSSTVEDLVVDALADLLFEAESRDLAFASFSARFAEGVGKARIIAAGSSVTTADLRGPPIKAVTYHDLVVRETGPGGWYGRVVFDV